MTSIPERWQQFYSPADQSDPNAIDMILNQAFQSLSNRNVKHEAEAELRRKEKVLKEIHVLFNNWVRQCAQEQHIEEVNGKSIEGRLETSGSWRLGIHEKDADIDCVCVAPRFCSIESFFDTFQSTIQNHPHVTNFNSIPGAFVPIMTFDYQEVNIDLLLAVLPHVNTVTQTFDILDDSVLVSMMESSRRSLNGPRDTLTISKLVRSAGSRVLDPPDADKRYDNFLQFVRVMRLWAKRRCLYSNKMGYLGGINFNLLCTMIIQMYPQKNPGCLFVKFFENLARWEKDFSDPTDIHNGVRWQHPVRLCRELTNVSSILDKEVYPQGRFGPVKGDMPIITPSYPAYNSAGNVNPWTLRVMNEELERGMKLVKQAEKLAQEEGDNEETLSKIGLLFDELLQPSDFFYRPDHNRFLAINVTSEQPNDVTFASFKTLTEAMFRNVISAMKYKHLGEYPMKRIHLLPKSFEDKQLDNKQEQKENTDENSTSSFEHGGNLCMFVSFIPDGNYKLELGDVVAHFERQVKTRFEKDHPEAGEAISIKPFYFLQNELPDFVFELGDIGKTKAKRLRKEMRKALQLAESLKVKEIKKKESYETKETDQKEVETAREVQAKEEDVGKPLILVDRGVNFESNLRDELSVTIDEEKRSAIIAKYSISQSELLELELWFQPTSTEDSSKGARGDKQEEEVKYLWVAAAEAHKRLPTLDNVGDRAVKTSLGTFTAHNINYRNEEVHCPKRFKGVKILS